jgi:hypothetical protein
MRIFACASASAFGKGVNMGIVDSFKDVFKVAETVNNIELYKSLLGVICG